MTKIPDEVYGLSIQYRPLVSIDLVIRDPERKLLLGFRQNRPAQGTWFVPGGVVRKDETLAHAFSRIAQTELGASFELHQSGLLGVFEHFYPDNALNEAGYGTHYVVLAYQVDVSSDFSPVPDDQHSHLKWLSNVEALSDPLVHENTKAYCRLSNAHVA